MKSKLDYSDSKAIMVRDNLYINYIERHSC